jgi:hypothetical protein
MKLVINCIWISLFTLVGISQSVYAAELLEPQPKETIALIGTGDFGNSFGPRLAALLCCFCRGPLWKQLRKI